MQLSLKSNFLCRNCDLDRIAFGQGTWLRHNQAKCQSILIFALPHIKHPRLMSKFVQLRRITHSPRYASLHLAQDMQIWMLTDIAAATATATNSCRLELAPCGAERLLWSSCRPQQRQ